MLDTFEISQEPVETMAMKPALDTLIGSTTISSSSVSVNYSTNSANSVSASYTKLFDSFNKTHLFINRQPLQHQKKDRPSLAYHLCQGSCHICQKPIYQNHLHLLYLLQ